ncbi:MAG: ribonuclease HII [Candidatus Omnitrophota bacterium]
MRKKRVLKKKSARYKIRLQKLNTFELSISGGTYPIAGVDEAGRGPLAGPVVASAVILTKRKFKNRIDDSKVLSPEERLAAFREIKKNGIIGVGIVNNKIIDKVNIFQATRLAMKKAVGSLKIKPHLLLIDGRMKLSDMPLQVKDVIKGDAKCLSISCASIIAKVTRDKIMEKYHRKFPSYGFNNNKGYPTKFHRKALLEAGPCSIHRMSFTLHH